MTDKKQVGRPKKVDALSNAQRQARYAEKRRLSRDAERRTFYLARTAELLGRYQAMLATEIKANPHSRFVALIHYRPAI